MPFLRDGTQLKDGTFVVLRYLGGGGFGEVYLARQQRMEREVAIKVIAGAVADDPAVLKRFEREALAAGSLLHPNVLPVLDFDFDEEAGVWFLAMQYVPGGRTLQDRLGAQLEFEEAARFVEAIASALDAAHARGIVHRDVKPANVLLDDRERPLLADFGVAHLNSLSTITATGLRLGTGLYMAPERWLGGTTDPASDQYSLGVMAYEMLAGRTPFVGEQHMLMRQHTNAPPPQLTSFNPNATPAMEVALARALSKRPDVRFGSCGEFAAALVDAIENQRLAALAERYDSGIGLWRAGDLPGALRELQAVRHERAGFRDVDAVVHRIERDAYDDDPTLPV